MRINTNLMYQTGDITCMTENTGMFFSRLYDRLPWPEENEAF